MKVFAQNTKAKNSYEFIEYFEAGIVLTGAETKSIRNGGISIIMLLQLLKMKKRSYVK